MKKEKARWLLRLCLNVVLLALVMIPLVFFSYRLIEGRINDLVNSGTDGYHSGFGLYVFASHIVLLAVNAVLTLIGVTGSILVKKRRQDPGQKKRTLGFRFLAFAPVCSQALYLIVTAVVMCIG